MSQHDQVINNDTGAAVRADINAALAALFGLSSGATAPATTIAYQPWADTATGLLKIRNAANSAWITVGTLASANLGLLSLAGGTLTGPLLNTGQAAFLATLATPLSNATGDATAVTTLTDAEAYDLTAAYSVPTFTAAVTGRYWFSATATLQQLAAGHTSGQLVLATSNRNYTLDSGNWGAMRDASNEYTARGGFIGVDMDAADTASLSLTVSGATKVVNIAAVRFAGGLLF